MFFNERLKIILNRTSTQEAAYKKYRGCNNVFIYVLIIDESNILLLKDISQQHCVLLDNI
jgi:hypothetical protein